MTENDNILLHKAAWTQENDKNDKKINVRRNIPEYRNLIIQSYKENRKSRLVSLGAPLTLIYSITA